MAGSNGFRGAAHRQPLKVPPAQKGRLQRRHSGRNIRPAVVVHWRPAPDADRRAKLVYEMLLR